MSAGERRRVGRGLRLTLRLEPGADVEDERGHTEQDEERDDENHRRLAFLFAPAAHSMRSVVELHTSPAATTKPSRLTSYG